MAEFITPGTVRDRSTVTPIQLSAGVECYEIVPAGTYAEALFAQQYELQNSSFELVADTNDRYLYILDGQGEFSFADHNNPLKEVSVKEGSAAMMLAGESGKLSTTSALSVVVSYLAPQLHGRNDWQKMLISPIASFSRVLALPINKRHLQIVNLKCSLIRIKQVVAQRCLLDLSQLLARLSTTTYMMKFA